jgi:NADP-dependent 3-hydroxy acid dehydrogenase YdfG
MAKVWMVTGANGGLGRAIVTTGVQAGHMVIAAARRPESVRDLVLMHPGRVEALRLDVTDLQHIDKAVAEVTPGTDASTCW